MRFAERFLILLAFIGFALHASGSTQGAAMQLVSFPPLALFYLLFTPSLLNAPWRGHSDREAPVLRIWMSVVSGMLIAYCLTSVLFASLGSFPRLYALESCGIAAGLFGIGALFLRKSELRDFRNGLLIRGLGITASLTIACWLKPAGMHWLG